MVTKEYIENLKQNDLNTLYKLISNNADNREVFFVLENLGRLPIGFKGHVFTNLLSHSNNGIRFWAVKNIGKLSDSNFIPKLREIAKYDNDSMIRREAISSIGRMRIKEAIPTLTEFLNDSDPKVILQALRGLLVFKSEPIVQNSIKILSNHPNETIQSVIRKEFNQTVKANSKIDPITFPTYMKNVIVHGDVREVLHCVPDESVHLTFTSPPYYNARDYSIYQSYKEYLDFLIEVFKLVHRVTKEGRFLIVNTSPIIIPRVSRAHSSKRYPIPFDLHARLVEIGWEFIDDIVWLKPETSVKNRNAGFLQHRKPLAYKPNAITEYLMVYRKQSDKLIDWNIRQYSSKITEESKIKGNYETSNVWKIDPTFDRIHSAVFPIELCNRVIKFYSFKGDLVFDPFGGSGTVGKAALNLGRSFFLTEQEKKYVERMKQGLSIDLFNGNKQPTFFDSESFRKHSMEKK